MRPGRTPTSDLASPQASPASEAEKWRAASEQMFGFFLSYQFHCSWSCDDYIHYDSYSDRCWYLVHLTMSSLIYAVLFRSLGMSWARLGLLPPPVPPLGLSASATRSRGRLPPVNRPVGLTFCSPSDVRIGGRGNGYSSTNPPDATRGLRSLHLDISELLQRLRRPRTCWISESLMLRHRQARPSHPCRFRRHCRQEQRHLERIVVSLPSPQDSWFWQSSRLAGFSPT